MRKITILSLILLSIATLTRCKKESIDIRDGFIGPYSVTETWTENSKTITKPAFSMSAGKSSQNASVVLLNNFANYGAGTTAEATVKGNSLTIPEQTLSNSKTITGSGSLSGATMIFTYTESYNSVSISITATALKR